MKRGSEPGSGAAPWRLIIHDAGDGSWNMAVDEAILEAYARAATPPAPTLRLYGWKPAAVSLGRSQSAAGAHDPEVLAAEGLDLVRRPTGGVAVLHEFERTYSVVGALGTTPFTGGVIETYRTVAEALRRGLGNLGIAAVPVEPRRGTPRDVTVSCFEHVGAWELVVGGRKLVGSAQARRSGAFLQHGTMPWRSDPSRLARVLGAPVDGSRFIDLDTARGSAVDPAALDRACIAGFEEAFGVPMVPGTLTEGEALRAAELRCWKYDSIAWTRGGKPGAREARWGPVVSG